MKRQFPLAALCLATAAASFGETQLIESDFASPLVTKPVPYAVLLPDNSFTVPMRLMGEAGIKVNLVFMFLNLLPILPLDGGRILASLLPNRVAWQYSRLEPWGLPLLVLLLLTNVLDIVLMPLVGTSDALIRALAY